MSNPDPKPSGLIQVRVKFFYDLGLERGGGETIWILSSRLVLSSYLYHFKDNFALYFVS